METSDFSYWITGNKDVKIQEPMVCDIITKPCFPETLMNRCK